MAGDIWYPSCVVNLRLRFDESFQIVDLPQPGPQGGDPAAISAPAATGVAGRAVDANQRYVNGSRPLITQRGADNLSFILNRVPKTANVELPGYRTAGKFSLEFDWRELPIDPRLVRSAAVEIYFGSVSPSDFSTGMTQVEPNGTRRSIMNTGDTEDKSNALMALAGTVDTWSSTHNGEGGTIKMEGRDLRGNFLDSPVNPAVAAKLDLTQSLDFVILDILSTHPAGAYISVIYSAEDWPGGLPPAVLDQQGLTRVRQGASGKQAGGAASTDDKLNFWDLITRYCFLVGAVPYFRGRNIVLRPAVSIFDQSKPKSSSSDKVFDPVTRIDDSGNPFTTRKMIFGRSVKELSFERKLGGVKVPTVEVVSFDTSSKDRGLKKLLVEQWPPDNGATASAAGLSAGETPIPSQHKAKVKVLKKFGQNTNGAKITNVSPSGEVSQSDKIRISVPGIRDRKRLLGIAKSIYEEVGRGELGGACTTTQLASYRGSNEDPDLLRIRPGDVCEFLTDTRAMTSQAPGASTYLDSTRKSFDEAVSDVKQALSGKTGSGDDNLARVLVASARSSVIDLLRSFRVANVVFTWGLKEGIVIKFDFQNYFVIRYGIQEQLGANTEAPVRRIANSSVARRPKAPVVQAPVVAQTPQVVRDQPTRTAGERMDEYVRKYTGAHFIPVPIAGDKDVLKEAAESSVDTLFTLIH